MFTQKLSAQDYNEKKITTRFQAKQEHFKKIIKDTRLFNAVLNANSIFMLTATIYGAFTASSENSANEEPLDYQSTTLIRATLSSLLVAFLAAATYLFFTLRKTELVEHKKKKLIATDEIISQLSSFRLQAHKSPTATYFGLLVAIPSIYQVHQAANYLNELIPIILLNINKMLSGKYIFVHPDQYKAIEKIFIFFEEMSRWNGLSGNANAKLLRYSNDAILISDSRTPIISQDVLNQLKKSCSDLLFHVAMKDLCGILMRIFSFQLLSIILAIGYRKYSNYLSKNQLNKKQEILTDILSFFDLQVEYEVELPLAYIKLSQNIIFKDGSFSKDQFLEFVQDYLYCIVSPYEIVINLDYTSLDNLQHIKENIKNHLNDYIKFIENVSAILSFLRSTTSTEILELWNYSVFNNKHFSPEFFISTSDKYKLDKIKNILPNNMLMLDLFRIKVSDNAITLRVINFSKLENVKNFFPVAIRPSLTYIPVANKMVHRNRESNLPPKKDKKLQEMNEQKIIEIEEEGQLYSYPWDELAEHRRLYLMSRLTSRSDVVSYAFFTPELEEKIKEIGGDIAFKQHELALESKEKDKGPGIKSTQHETALSAKNILYKIKVNNPFFKNTRVGLIKKSYSSLPHCLFYKANSLIEHAHQQPRISYYPAE